MDEENTVWLSICLVIHDPDGQQACIKGSFCNTHSAGQGAGLLLQRAVRDAGRAQEDSRVTLPAAKVSM